MNAGKIGNYNAMNLAKGTLEEPGRTAEEDCRGNGKRVGALQKRAHSLL
jgi:hypothetical protein